MLVFNICMVILSSKLSKRVTVLGRTAESIIIKYTEKNYVG